MASKLEQAKALAYQLAADEREALARAIAIAHLFELEPMHVSLDLEGLLPRFDNIEVDGMVVLNLEEALRGEDEVTLDRDDDEPDFFGVFGHYAAASDRESIGATEWLADFLTRAEAEAFAGKLKRGLRR